MIETKTVYAATHIHKEVAEDSYYGGEATERRYTLHEAINVTAGSLADLLTEIGNQYGLTIDEVFMPDDPAVYFAFDRYEDADSNPIDLTLGTVAHERFRKGRLKVWHAIYSFMIEKRVVSPIEGAEFEQAGIKLRD